MYNHQPVTATPQFCGIRAQSGQKTGKSHVIDTN